MLHMLRMLRIRRKAQAVGQRSKKNKTIYKKGMLSEREAQIYFTLGITQTTSLLCHKQKFISITSDRSGKRARIEHEAGGGDKSLPLKIGVIVSAGYLRIPAA
jgi:hypothetical protein